MQSVFGRASGSERISDLHDPQQVQDDEDDGDYDQNMDPTARFRDA
jgi:hypothetical protein